MNIDLAIERSLLLPAAYKTVEPLLHDLEGTLGRFPKLKKLTRLGEMEYLWEMQTIGSKVAKIAHNVSYGARYTLDAKHGLLSWTPIKGKGNAEISGHFQIERSGDGTRLGFKVKGRLADVPVPLLYRPLAGGFIQGKFVALVDEFLARTGNSVAAK